MLENQCTVCTPNISFLIYLLCPRWLADAHLLPAWEDQASLNAILRKTGLSPTALYDRLAFIHRRTIAFETFKVRKLKDTQRKHRQHFSLAVAAAWH